MSLKALKIVTILAAPIAVGTWEVLRHLVFVEEQPMIMGNLIIFVSVLIAAFFYSRFIFGIIERMQQESLRRNEELAALNSVALAVSKSLNLDVILYRALDKVLQVTTTDAGEIFLQDESTEEMVQRVHSGLFPEAFGEKTRFRIGEGFIGAMAQAGEPMVVEDISEDRRWLRDKVRGAGFHSLVGVPLKSKNTVIGVINLATLSRRRFTHEDIRLLTNIGNQIAVAIENARLHEKVQGVAALEERERIAREMHDSLAQVLSYVNTKTQAVRQLLSTGQQAQAETYLKELETVAQDTYVDVREAILGLRSTDSLQKGMVSILKEYIFRFSQLSDTKAELEMSDGGGCSLETTTEFQVIRIIQEALTNVRKHARARHAWVRITANGDQVNIIVEDDGRGFNTSKIRRGEWPQFGLQTMRERAESVGGTLDITSTTGKGTEVKLRIPLTQRTGI